MSSIYHLATILSAYHPAIMRIYMYINLPYVFYIVPITSIYEMSLEIVNFVPDGRPSGPLLQSFRVGEALAERDIITRIITSKQIAEDTQGLANSFEIELQTVTFRRVRSPSRVYDNIRFLHNLPSSIRHFKKILNNIDPDIVQVYGWFTLGPSVASSRLDIPVLWYLPDMMVPSSIVYFTRSIVRRYGSKIVAASDAVSEYFFKESSDISVIYPPVDTTKFNPENVHNKQDQQLRYEFNIPQEAPIIGTVGNISPNKGYQYLIQSMKTIVDNHPSARLIIVGSLLESKYDYYESLQEQVSKLNLHENVIFTGYREDVVRLLSLFDVFAFASLNEASPQAVLEAMAMEVPVVATDVGGIPELIVDGKSGVLVPSESPDIFSINILELLEDNASRKQLGRSARDRTNNRFSIERCANDFKQAYYSIINE